MIEELYHASEAGVEIDLIVRGICCLVPNQPYSANIGFETKAGEVVHANVASSFISTEQARCV